MPLNTRLNRSVTAATEIEPSSAKKKAKVERKPSARRTTAKSSVAEKVNAGTYHRQNGASNGDDHVLTSKSTSARKSATSNNSTSQLLDVTSTSAKQTISINEESTSTDTLNITHTDANLTTASVRSTASSSRANRLLELIPDIVRPNRVGTLLSVGENLSNQLGLGTDVDNRKKPQLVRELPNHNIIQIAAGGMHSAVLSGDGDVYTFGCNDEFALGRDDNEDIDKVDLPEKCIEVTAGDSHTAALSVSGRVYAWGTFRDGSGVLGLNQKSTSREKIEKIAKRPVELELSSNIVKIASGADHLVALTCRGEVYTAGNSEHGQLGRVSKYNAQRGGRRGPDMLLEPALVRFGFKRELKIHRQIEDVFTTPYCTFLKVKDSDVIIGFGLNNSHQLGIVSNTENCYQPEVLSSLKFSDGARLKKACGGMHHTLLLDTLGRVYALGSHRYGALGLDKIEADVSTPQRIPTLSNIVDIAANTSVSYALSDDGKVFSWGSNYSKQLGQDTEDDYFVPTHLQSRQMDMRDVYAVSVGGQHALFIVSQEKPTKMEE